METRSANLVGRIFRRLIEAACEVFSTEGFWSQLRPMVTRARSAAWAATLGSSMCCARTIFARHALAC